MRFAATDEPERFEEAAAFAERIWDQGQDYTAGLLELLRQLLSAVTWQEALGQASAELLEGTWARAYQPILLGDEPGMTKSCATNPEPMGPTADDEPDPWRRAGSAQCQQFLPHRCGTARNGGHGASSSYVEATQARLDLVARRTVCKVRPIVERS